MGLYILDVSGHGTSAALLSVSLSRALVPSPQQGGILKRSLPKPPYYEVVPPEEVANELNRRFRLMEQSGRFCTFLYGVLDVAARRLRYVSAGHPGPIEVLAGIPKSHDHGSGIPIGVLPDVRYSAQEIDLSQGSQVFLYTDGVTEARNREHEAFGIDRLLLMLSESATGSGPDGVQAAVHALCDQLLDFTRGERQRDDITLVGMSVA